MKVKEMKPEFPRRLSYAAAQQYGYDESGREVLDPRPLAIPFDCKKPESLEQAISRIMQIREANQLDDEWESESESQDFDVDDDDDFEVLSRYESPDLFNEYGEALPPKGAEPSADGEADSAQAPEPKPKKARKAAKVEVEPEPVDDDQD